MAHAAIKTDGVLCKSPTDYKRESLFLRRVVDKGGDSILVSLAEIEGIAYIVPTAALRSLLDETLEEA